MVCVVSVGRQSAVSQSVSMLPMFVVSHSPLLVFSCKGDIALLAKNTQVKVVDFRGCRNVTGEF